MWGLKPTMQVTAHAWLVAPRISAHDSWPTTNMWHDFRLYKKGHCLIGLTFVFGCKEYVWNCKALCRAWSMSSTKSGPQCHNEGKLIMNHAHPRKVSELNIAPLPTFNCFIWSCYAKRYEYISTSSAKRCRKFDYAKMYILFWRCIHLNKDDTEHSTTRVMSFVLYTCKKDEHTRKYHICGSKKNSKSQIQVENHRKQQKLAFNTPLPWDVKAHNLEHAPGQQRMSYILHIVPPSCAHFRLTLSLLATLQIVWGHFAQCLELPPSNYREW